MKKYLKIYELLDLIDEPWGSKCRQILNDYWELFQKSRGSTHNHQTWEGGYIDHITDGMNFMVHLYPFMLSFGRRIPFSLSDALLVFFLHDLEKPWRIIVDKVGVARNSKHISTKADFKKFREEKIKEYGIILTPDQQNAFTYIEGEIADYSSERRVMNELSAFCHMVDTWCARGWYDYPKIAGEDEWTGADRFRI